MIKIKIRSTNGKMPLYETAGAAGMDLQANIKDAVTIKPGDIALIPTGLFIEIPEGMEGQIRARSGLAVKHAIGLVNGIGTIDSDYRGELQVPLINWSQEVFTVEDGDRIAQLVIAKCESVCWEPVEEISDTDRGEGGFGHTGRRGK